MNTRIKSMFRAANLLRHAVLRRRRNPTDVWLPAQQWADCAAVLRRIRLATERGWHQAAAQTRKELLYHVDQCRSYLHDVSLGIQQLDSAGKSPSEADIFRELAALETEFDGFELDFENEELCVTTPSVRLEGTYLGPFQIRLNWRHHDNPLSYRVVALEANPAASNESVTHPHVSDENVCEGDARQSIRAALDDGRLADFFVIVWRLLETYSPGAPTSN